MKLILEREFFASDETINLGLLRDFDDDHFSLSTLENPWLDNEPYISCIPKGSHTCKRVDSPRYGNTFQVIDVLGRTHILFHWGNWEKNTLGCVLVGCHNNGKDMILQSRKGFGRFMRHTEDVDEFLLCIV